MKRLFDIVLSFLGLVVLSPVMLVVYFLVKKRLGSPVFFKQLRPGLQGKPFEMIKFRTMLDAVDSSGNPLPDNLRMTKFGSFLRSSSLDELPGLWNVLKGDMSLVGPRPEVRHYVDYWTPEQMHVLDVQPGITDPASIKFRNENELMEKAENPEDYYIHVIMQEKIKLYLEYVEKHSFWYDIMLIFKTFKVIMTER